MVIRNETDMDMEAKEEERGPELRHGQRSKPGNRTVQPGEPGPLRDGLKEARKMNDLEYHRQVPVHTSDLYLELQRIEERGIRLKKARKNRLAALFAFVSRKKNTGAAETA